MPRKFFRKLMPDVDKVREVKALSMFGDTLFHPALWHLNRRSAAGGVAVGMFCGLIPGPLQMLSAAIVCVFLRVNLPLALVTTLYTNPVTIVPLYLLAYEIGGFALGARGFSTPPALPEWEWTQHDRIDAGDGQLDGESGCAARVRATAARVHTGRARLRVGAHALEYLSAPRLARAAPSLASQLKPEIQVRPARAGRLSTAGPDRNATRAPDRA